MKTLHRYAQLFGVQFKSSLLLAVQYRAEFFLDGVLAMLWTVTAIVPLFIVYRDRPSVAGWTFPESLIVLGWFTLLDGILEGAINPSLVTVVDHIRKGTLDFVLLKPADAQFLVSTSKFLVFRSLNVVSAGVIFTYAFLQMHRAPSFYDIATALCTLGFATTVLYSLSILVISMAFVVIRVDNLSHFFAALFDVARWPIGVFRGFVRFFFTFILPLALMTTVPAQALLGKLDSTTLLASFVGTLAFGWSARQVWKRSLRNYTSASS